MAGRITARAGSAEGGIIAVIPIARTAGREDFLRAWVATQLFPELLKQRGIVGVWYGERDAATIASAAADVSRKTDRFLDGVLVVEGVTGDALDAAMPLLAWDRIAAQGGGPDAPPARLRVCYTVHVPPGGAA